MVKKGLFDNIGIRKKV